MQRSSVWRGALWLSMGSFVSRFLGAVYRIFLPRVLGDYGLGLFQMAYPLYSVLLAVSINGAPTALAKMTAERISQGDEDNAATIAAWAQVFLGGIGLILALSMELGAPWIARRIFSEPAAEWSIRALSPALAFVAVEAGLRGLFQGRQAMAPTAGSQIVEQIVRILVMFPMAMVLMPRGVEWAAAGATLGAPAGAVAGVVFLLVILHRQGGMRLQSPVPWRAMKRLLAIAAPMSLAGLLFPLLMLADSVLVPERLRAVGFTLAAATAEFGRLSGEALPLINLTMVVGTALGVTLVPAIARAVAVGDWRLAAKRVDQAIDLVWIAGLPMSVGLFCLANPITQLLYGETGAAGALKVLAAGAAVLSLQQVVGFSLQAGGYGWVPVRNLLYGAVTKFGVTWALTPTLGIRGAAFGTVLAAAVAAYANVVSWMAITKTPGLVLWKLIRGSLWPLASSLVMAMAIEVWRSQGPAGAPMQVAGGLIVGVLIYVAGMVAAGQGQPFLRLIRER